jgi:alanine racemase
MIESLNRVEVSLPSLCHNFAQLQKRADNRPVLAMVKADAYGHGMVECARVLEEQGVSCFGVAEAVEGVILRRAGITRPVLIMAGVLPEIVPILFDFTLTPVVVDDSCLQELSLEAVRREQPIGLHVKVDAGMGRQGCSYNELAAILKTIEELPGISLQGIMAHLPMADEPDSLSTPEITREFSRQLDNLRQLVSGNVILHLANSGGVLYFPAAHLDMIRPGISLYGCYPNGQQGTLYENAVPLEPVMRFTSRIIQVKNVDAGTGLGYGHSFITKRPTRIALIPAGYEDGYLRCLTNNAAALVHGRRVRVVGRISMNLTMLDVTDIDQPVPGDEVVLLGRQGKNSITAEEIADWMGTINYEVLCLFGNLNARVYVSS